ncbi:hypothetical protein [Streptomyces yaizuensis]|uniref:Uncharacterized protein n=1 Tax=Streptomyces yaizuensis TaxID=2989713 RepID=A0ABQ5P6G6_9ACTN|nr:hypothetical protein [Streptomyces sp. YSPA8]GLF98159.1 hypothetical protein SYYSPA8_27700 [Streptomyces sp. YSPA8]
MPGTRTDNVWIIEADGVPLEVPATIAGVREQLDGEQRAVFDREVERTAGNYLDRVLLRWALPGSVLAEAGGAERVERGSLDGFARTVGGGVVAFTVVPEEAPDPGVPATWGMSTPAGRVRRPATIAGIREALDPGRRERFDEEIRHVPGHRLFQRLVMWATPPEAAAQIDAEGDRIGSGDLTGVSEAGEVEH